MGLAHGHWAGIQSRGFPGGALFPSRKSVSGRVTSARPHPPASAGASHGGAPGAHPHWQTPLLTSNPALQLQPEPLPVFCPEQKKENHPLNTPSVKTLVFLHTSQSSCRLSFPQTSLLLLIFQSLLISGGSGLGVGGRWGADRARRGSWQASSGSRAPRCDAMRRCRALLGAGHGTLGTARWARAGARRCPALFCPGPHSLCSISLHVTVPHCPSATRTSLPGRRLVLCETWQVSSSPSQDHAPHPACLGPRKSL